SRNGKALQIAAAFAPDAHNNAAAVGSPDRRRRRIAARSGIVAPGSFAHFDIRAGGEASQLAAIDIQHPKVRLGVRLHRLRLRPDEGNSLPIGESDIELMPIGIAAIFLISPPFAGTE